MRLSQDNYEGCIFMLSVARVQIITTFPNGGYGIFVVEYELYHLSDAYNIGKTAPLVLKAATWHGRE